MKKSRSFAFTPSTPSRSAERNVGVGEGCVGGVVSVGVFVGEGTRGVPVGVGAAGVSVGVEVAVGANWVWVAVGVGVFGVALCSNQSLGKNPTPS